MSGFACVLNFDGRAVDPLAVKRMADALSYRGPDEQRTLIDRNLAFLHAMLHTTQESVNEDQPYSWNGEFVIAGDIRVDARDELLSSLTANGVPVTNMAPDIELVLHAYRTWGEQCVHHLLGDFSFIIWDASSEQLFGARDHLGIKTLFLSRSSRTFLAGNTLCSLRQHPSHCSALNDTFIGDFLVFRFSQDAKATAYSDIERLPPAHFFTFRKGDFKVTKYWELPTDGCVRYKRAFDYVEHFEELLARAVSDRLRTNRIAVLMSGGLDSTTIAATAQRLGRVANANFDLRAYTLVHRRTLEDDEGAYATSVAEKLGFPIRLLDGDDTVLFEGWDNPLYHSGEPLVTPTFAHGERDYRTIREQSNVVLLGEGADPLLRSPKNFVKKLLAQQRFGRAMTAILQSIVINRRLPPLGLRTAVKEFLGIPTPPQYTPVYPDWLDADFEEHHKLRERWADAMAPTPSRHPVRPEAHLGLIGASWQFIFEYFAAGVSRVPLEIRYPFLDLRLVEYLLAMPAWPWFNNKGLLRAHGRGILPRRVLQRRKSVPAHYPQYRVSPMCSRKNLQELFQTPGFSKFIDGRKVSYDFWTRNRLDHDGVRMEARLISLACFLRYYKTTCIP